MHHHRAAVPRNSHVLVGIQVVLRVRSHACETGADTILLLGLDTICADAKILRREERVLVAEVDVSSSLTGGRSRLNVRAVRLNRSKDGVAQE